MSIRLRDAVQVLDCMNIILAKGKELHYNFHYELMKIIDEKDSDARI